MSRDRLTAFGGLLTVPQMSVAESQPKHQFVVLDGLRGGAAIMVVITHTTNLAPMAFNVIGFFFVLSGFVLAYGPGAKLRVSGPHGRANRIRFIASRLIRIYPLYFTGTAIALLPAASFALIRSDFWTPKVYAEAIAAAPFFIPLPYELTFPLNLPGWTLTYELLANFVFLFTGWRWLPVLSITVVSGFAMLWDSGDSYWGTIAGEIPVALFCYFLGVALCRAWCETLLPKIGMNCLALLALLCLALAYPATDHPVLYSALLTVLILPWIVWTGACSNADGFAARLMAWLGSVSYGIYILHYPILMCVNASANLLAEWHPRLAGRINNYPVWIVLPGSLLAAHLLTARLDAPVRKWLWERFEASRATAPQRA